MLAQRAATSKDDVRISFCLEVSHLFFFLQSDTDRIFHSDLKNKSDFDLIRKKYEAEDQFEYPRSPPSSHPPLYGSLTSDPVTSSSLENSIYFDPAGGPRREPISTKP